MVGDSDIEEGDEIVCVGDKVVRDEWIEGEIVEEICLDLFDCNSVFCWWSVVGDIGVGENGFCGEWFCKFIKYIIYN